MQLKDISHGERKMRFFVKKNGEFFENWFLWKSVKVKFAVEWVSHDIIS